MGYWKLALPASEIKVGREPRGALTGLSVHLNHVTLTSKPFLKGLVQALLCCSFETKVGVEQGVSMKEIVNWWLVKIVPSC